MNPFIKYIRITSFLIVYYFISFVRNGVVMDQLILSTNQTKN
jgi:hypothetical protein